MNFWMLSLGRMLGYRLAKRYGHKIGLTDEHIEKLFGKRKSRLKRWWSGLDERGKALVIVFAATTMLVGVLEVGDARQRADEKVMKEITGRVTLARYGSGGGGGTSMVLQTEDGKEFKASVPGGVGVRRGDWVTVRWKQKKGSWAWVEGIEVHGKWRPGTQPGEALQRERMAAPAAGEEVPRVVKPEKTREELLAEARKRVEEEAAQKREQALASIPRPTRETGKATVRNDTDFDLEVMIADMEKRGVKSQRIFVGPDEEFSFPIGQGTFGVGTFRAGWDLGWWARWFRPSARPDEIRVRIHSTGIAMDCAKCDLEGGRMEQDTQTQW